MTLSIPKGERNREYKANLKEVFEDVYSTMIEPDFMVSNFLEVCNWLLDLNRFEGGML